MGQPKLRDGCAAVGVISGRSSHLHTRGPGRPWLPRSGQYAPWPSLCATLSVVSTAMGTAALIAF